MSKQKTALLENIGQLQREWCLTVLVTWDLDNPSTQGQTSHHTNEVRQLFRPFITKWEVAKFI